MIEEDLFKRMARIKKNADNAFHDFFEKPKMLALPTMKKQLQGLNQPMEEILVKGGKVVAKIKMPGIDKKDVVLNVGRDFIEVKAEKKSESRDQKPGIFTHQKSYSVFFRRLPLPVPVNPAKMESSFRDGFLEITMPRAVLHGKKRVLRLK